MKKKIFKREPDLESDEDDEEQSDVEGREDDEESIEERLQERNEVKIEVSATNSNKRIRKPPKKFEF